MDVLDLSAAIPVDSATIDILLPGSDKPSGWRIELAGPGHPKTVAVSQEVSRERLDKEKAIEFAQVNGRKWKTDGETPEERAQRNVTRVVRRIIGWSPPPVFKHINDGKPIEFSETAAVDLLLRPEMGWVLAQIADYLNAERAFTQGSALS